LVGCIFLIPGDPGISLYAWNKGDDAYVMHVGRNTGQCYAIESDSIGEFYGAAGPIDEFGES
jgi:hypothetical protein